MKDTVYELDPEDWRDAILIQAAKIRGKRTSEKLPAYMQPGPKAKRSYLEARRRKARRKMARASRKQNRKR